MAEKEKDIYDLKLHEAMIVTVKSIDQERKVEFQVIRVPGGWLYRDDNPRVTEKSDFFVPFHDKEIFKDKKK